MAIIDKPLISEYGIKALFDKKWYIQNENDLIENSKKSHKEPHIDGMQKATYNLEYMLYFLRTLSKIKCQYITVELKDKEPIKITGINNFGHKITFWLAPYVDE